MNVKNIILCFLFVFPSSGFIFNRYQCVFRQNRLLLNNGVFDDEPWPFDNDDGNENGLEEVEEEEEEDLDAFD